MEVFEETDTDAPDTWTGGVPTFQCPYRDTNDRLYCYMSYSLPMEFIEHMQECHSNVDLDTDTL